MADEYETDPTPSGASRREPRGEDLASDMLPEGQTELSEGSLDGDADLRDVDEAPLGDTDDPEVEPYVDDPEELSAAEAEVDEMPDSEPESTPAPARSRRPKRRTAPAVVAEVDEERPGLTEKSSTGTGATAAGSLRPKKRAAEVQKKDEPTPSRRRRAKSDDEHRTGPIQFVKESVAELRKVVWPTGSQLWQYFVVVLVFVLFIIAFVMALDFVFTWLLLKFLG